ncbi:ABC transporter permease [Clostridium swellfunianum]|uniref:ABC transporter permease n=1 Tax=Clostridium swellfunianum TaxID=1367462 RepID=UPI00202EC7C5|nr:ABC transporter permease [Clostridium swellfunianum]
MKLLQNELLKLFKARRLYVFFLLLTATTVITVYYYINSDAGMQTVIETANAQSLPIVLKYSTAQFFSIFMAIYIADIITDEYKTGSLKLSMLRPISRATLLKSKVSAIFAFTVILTLFFILSTYAIGIVSFGWGNSTVYNGITYSTIDGVLLTVKVFAVSILPLIAFGMITAFIAVSSNSMTTTIAISIGITMLGQYLNALPSIKVFSVVNQMLFFSDYFVKINNPGEMMLSVIVNLVYIVVFYLLAVTKFKKKDILC